MTGGETGTELATIERAMGDRHSEYFSGPRIDGETVMARRYRSLIEAGSAAASTSLATAAVQTGELHPENNDGTSAPAAPCWETPVGQRILHEWSRYGGIERNYEAARIFSADIFAAMPAETRDELQGQIEGLSDSIQAAMMAELASPYVPAEAAMPPQIARFSTTKEGTELIQEWGYAAPQRLAAMKARVQRLVDRLTPDDVTSFAYFVDHISGAEFKALSNYLSK
jgi:hypothetical protein